MRPKSNFETGELKLNLRFCCTSSMLKTVDPSSISSLPATRVYGLKLGIRVLFKKSLRQLAVVSAYLLDNKLAVQNCTFARLKEAVNLLYPISTDCSPINLPFKEDEYLDSVEKEYNLFTFLISLSYFLTNSYHPF